MPLPISLSDDVVDIGDDIIITATFTNLATGAPANPSAQTWQIQPPGGTLETFHQADLASTVVGTWTLTYTVTANKPGVWYVRARGTAGVLAAAEGPFTVRASEFATP